MRKHSDGEVKPLSPRAQEALGHMHAELGRERYDEAQLPQPTALDHVPAALGLPVALFEHNLVRPWATWTFGAGAACVGAAQLWARWNAPGFDAGLDPEFARSLGMVVENASEPDATGLVSLLNVAFESAFTPRKAVALVGSLWMLHVFSAAAEHLLGAARVLALLGAGLLVAALAQFALLPGAEVQPLFLLGPTAAAAAFVVLREPFARVGVLLGFGLSLLHLNDDPWLRMPLWLWALLWALGSALYLSVLDESLLAIELCAAAVGLAAAAPGLLRRWRAQPSPSTRL